MKKNKKGHSIIEVASTISVMGMTCIMIYSLSTELNERKNRSPRNTEIQISDKKVSDQELLKRLGLKKEFRTLGGI